MFGRKIELSEISTIGGELIGQVGQARGMILNPDPIPLYPSDGLVSTELVGTMGSRNLGPGAAQVLAATAGKRSADALARHASRRSLHRSRDESLDARLARLGIGAAMPALDRARWFTIVDMPL